MDPEKPKESETPADDPADFVVTPLCLCLRYHLRAVRAVRRQPTQTAIEWRVRMDQKELGLRIECMRNQRMRPGRAMAPGPDNREKKA